MVAQHVIVDGSNIATEGRTTPSLQQLDDAVRAFVEEYAGVRVTVVVDATFGHRINTTEKAAYEEAALAGELVSPPAGAIGRGDAFVLQIADKAEASVLSNDSFQEFHGTYDWLFDEGRLIGGKPVPDIGWIFVLRTPVRGPASRRSTRTRSSRASKAGTGDTAPVIELVPSPEPATTKTTSGSGSRSRSRKKASADTVDPSQPMPTPKAPPPRSSSSAKRPSPAKRSSSAKRPSSATEDAPSGGRRRRGAKATATVNEPVPFLAFVSAHPLGASVEGTVDRFSSHGAYVTVGDANCYVPLKSMGDPPPKSAREALSVGETRSFVVETFDSPRRSIDLAIPGFAQVDEGASPSIEEGGPSPSSVPAPVTEPAQEAPNMAVARKSTARKSAAKKSTAKRSTARKAPAKRSTAKKSAAKKSTARKAPAKKASAKKSTAKKAAAKKSTAKKAAAKKSTKKSPARKAGARKSTTRKRAS